MWREINSNEPVNIDNKWETLYWSNEFGWVDNMESADIFTETERNTLNLPIDGCWISQDNQKKGR